MSASGQIYSRVISASSDAHLFTQIWSVICPDWRDRLGTSQMLQETEVEEGFDSPYRFGDEMRRQLGEAMGAEQMAEIYSFCSKGYFCAGEFNPDGTTVVFYIPKKGGNE